MMFVGAGADEIHGSAVQRGALRKQPPNFHLRHRRRQDEACRAQSLGNLVEQRFNRRHADHFQHTGNIVGRVRNESHRVSPTWIRRPGSSRRRRRS